jgi:ATPase family associated with various cellular activities (AAA)
MTFHEQYRAALQAGVPLVCVRTFDAHSTTEGIKNLETKTTFSLILWDTVKGWQGINEAGKQAITNTLAKTGASTEQTRVLPECLLLADSLPADSILFISNAHLFWGNEPTVIQGIWNLRDTFKLAGKVLILMTGAGSILPVELANDILVLDEPLPTVETLQDCVKSIFEYSKLPEPDQTVLDGATKALIGLPYFPAEQSVAMCVDYKSKSLNLDNLWERKRQAINQTRGLKVLTGKESIDDIGGLTQVKEYLCRVCEGMEPPNLILFLDEVEKAFAGSGTDTSGVSTKLTGSMLEWTEDQQIRGMLSLGIPGVGKSQLAKGIGNKYGIPVIKFDLPGMESGIVGSSNEHLKNAQAMIDSISGGKVLMLATCNSVNSLPAELKRRFSAATFFFDAPETAQERKAIWQIYQSKYNLPEQPLPNDAGWTGAEIKNCAYTAHTLKLTLVQASQYIVPVTVSDKARIDALRRDSSGKYLSASYAGVYNWQGDSAPVPSESGSGRRMREE